MSFSVDANILLYASNSASDVHADAVGFLEECMAGSELFYLAWPTVMAYLRIGTHPGIFSSPMPVEKATGNISQLLALPHVRVLAEGEGFWEVYLELCRPLTVRGNLVPDANLAALLRENGVRRLYTRDRDFRKFDGLEVVDPFEA